MVAMLGGALGGYHFMQYSAADAVRREANEARRRVEGTSEATRAQHDPQRLPDAKAERDAEVVRRQAEANRLAQSAAAQRKAEEEAAARAQSEAQRKSLAEAKHEAEARLAEERAQAEAIRVAEAARQRAEADRIAAEDAARQRPEAQRVVAATLSAEDRAGFVRRVQEVLKASHCSDGAINGSSSDAQKGVDRFVETARKHGEDKPAEIELAKATASDFDTWLHDANNVKANLCFIPQPKPERKVVVTKSSDTSQRPDRSRRAETSDAAKSGGDGRVRCWNGRTSSSSIGCRNGTQ
jgi:membrane protein involved in colicin uptake